MNLSCKNFTAGALALASFLIVANVGAAELAAKANGIAIKYSQEELNTPADAESLYRKLKQASRKACGLDGGFLNLGEKTRAQKCYDATLADTVHTINRPLLTQLHDSLTSKQG
jgi:UrcA family protein